MSGALLGSLSCARCARILPGDDLFCTTCGARQLPATEGGALSQTGGLLAGVVPSAPARRRSADAIDIGLLVVVAALVGLCGVAANSHAAVIAVAGGVAVLATVIVQVMVLSRTGRTLGLRLLGLRRVDNLTALPPSVVDAVVPSIVTRRPRSLLTADLTRGRDPLEPARALAILAEHAVAGAEPSPSERPQGQRAEDPGTDAAHPGAAPRRSRHGSRATAPAESGGPAYASVRLVFDSGDEIPLRGSLLVGRNPETDGGGTPVHALPDLSRSLSRTHALLDWRDGLLWVTDLNSASGSAIVDSSGGYRPLVPGLKTAASLGWRVEIGRRSIEILPGDPA
ncbi:FHA domain-containing protein [Frondihabitans sp. VKM Ac-2883]|jgi:hypothetical protein|uniref:RDD family protein n=1 Tax=Frondihabitans sp. VKM Ac-2883 TaxID=2783823 RepID=UPI00188A34CC|nr:FHA domain-containing protein [Frondihabitans sp. VKM Ac-2883]MBF4577756.1 RDD family protein [Frondihabitans sp. VKM Ac-2883]